MTPKTTTPDDSTIWANPKMRLDDAGSPAHLSAAPDISSSHSTASTRMGAESVVTLWRDGNQPQHKQCNP